MVIRLNEEDLAWFGKTFANDATFTRA